VSSPPAGIAVVVGGDTNNGFAGDLPLAWCPHHQRGLRIAAGLVSSPPAGIAVVVGGDTNNGFAGDLPLLLELFDLKGT